MRDHRGSYWKTVIAASLAGAGALVLLPWLSRPTLLGRGAGPPAGRLVWGGLGGIVVVLGMIAAWSALVVTGGLIALRRDRLETRGVPYARRQRRERVAGPAVLAMRRLIRRMRSVLHRSSGRLHLRPGELVEVRALEEILETLDDQGTLDGLPFMPEMSVFCGRQFRVFRRVDKLHDWIRHTGLRRVHNTVLLEGVRCDGRYHGGCQAACHLRWKEAWLRRSSAETRASSPPPSRARVREADLHDLTQRVEESGTVRYVCQLTELAAGTTRLAWADPRHYLRDLCRGNVRLRPFLEGVSIAVFNWVQRKRGGVPYPCLAPVEQKTSPHQVLNLQAGEVVRVKTKREIEQTLNRRSRNRGLWFDAEMLRFCGGKYRVLTRVERLIDERAGSMVHPTNSCIILEGVTATGEYRGFCPENESIFWREIWLARAPAPSSPPRVGLMPHARRDDGERSTWSGLPAPVPPSRIGGDRGIAP